MKSRILLNFSLATILLASFSCKKENEGCKTMRDHPKDFLDYWFFPQGSWWVYQRTDTVGMIDTILCSRSEKINDIGDIESPPPCEYYYSLRNEHTNGIFKDETHNGSEFYSSQFWSTEPLKSMLYIVDATSKKRFPEIAPYGQLFLYPIEIGDSTLRNFIIADTLPVIYSLLGINYVNCIHIESKKSKSHFYFSKNIGVVKKVYSDGTIWILSKYFINK